MQCFFCGQHKDDCDCDDETLEGFDDISLDEETQ